MARVTTEFVVADRAEAPTLAQGHLEGRREPYLRCFNLDILSLVRLQCLLQAQPFSAELATQFAVLHRAPDSKCVVTEIPQPFCAILARAQEEELSRVNALWRETEGIVLARWHDTYRAEVLGRIADLARQAITKKCSLLLRIHT